MQNESIRTLVVNLMLVSAVGKPVVMLLAFFALLLWR